MIDELRERYIYLTDLELLAMVHYEHSEYTNEAINAANSILEERGLSKPSEELLQQAKRYRTQIEASEKDPPYLIAEKKFKRALNKTDYFFLGRWSFWCVVGYGFYSAFIGLKVAVANLPSWPVWLLFILDAAFKIGLFGIIPVILFIIGGLKLSPQQRKERKMILFMPKSFVFIYGLALLLFLSLVIMTFLQPFESPVK